MKFLILLSLLTLTFVALTSADPDSSESEVIVRPAAALNKRSWKNVWRGIKKIAKKTKEAFDKIGTDTKKKFEKFGKDLKTAFRKFGKDAKKTFVKLGKDIEKEAVKVAKDFEKTSKLVGFMFTKDMKVLGHFFVTENKKVSHFFVNAGKTIRHVGKDMYMFGRDQFKKLIKNVDFEEVLKRLIPLINADITIFGCSTIASGVTSLIVGPEAEPVAGPIYDIICKVGLHVIRMIVDSQVKKH